MTATTTRELLEAALGYARRGWPVFPCKPDKAPYTPHGFKDATTDPAAIRQWCLGANSKGWGLLKPAL